MGTDRWQNATIVRGKPRVYIQQYLDFKLPEAQYEAIVKEMGLKKPYSEETASQVMEAYLEDLADDSQFDAVHLQRGDGLVVLMTVVSLPFGQELFDRMLAAHMAKKALGGED